MSRALDLLRGGDWSGALAALAGPGPRDAAWHAVRGMALLAHEDWVAAESALAAAMELGDSTKETALNRALARSSSTQASAGRACSTSSEARRSTGSAATRRRSERR